MILRMLQTNYFVCNVMVYKLIFNQTEIVFDSWEELQEYIYNLEKIRKRKKEQENIYKVETDQTFRVDFEE